ncbi:MAG TPA: sulfotransferase, partial [Rhizomicrobium sp.]
FLHPEQVPLWDLAAAGGLADWEEIFASYESSCDWPSCHFYKELAAFYPQAKIVLSVRDPKSWYRSVEGTILHHLKAAAAGRPGGPPGKFAGTIISEKTFRNDFSEANMIGVYEGHNEEVKRAIPRDRLLVFDAKTGWEPLCGFLGVPVPDAPFPRNNTTEEFQAREATKAAGAAS